MELVPYSKGAGRFKFLKHATTSKFRNTMQQNAKSGSQEGSLLPY